MNTRDFSKSVCGGGEVFLPLPFLSLRVLRPLLRGLWLAGLHTLCRLAAHADDHALLVCSTSLVCDIAFQARVCAQVSPSPCPAGEYTGVEEQSQCALCAPGTYQPQTGQVCVPAVCVVCLIHLSCATGVVERDSESRCDCVCVLMCLNRVCVLTVRACICM